MKAIIDSHRELGTHELIQIDEDKINKRCRASSNREGESVVKQGKRKKESKIDLY